VEQVIAVMVPHWEKIVLPSPLIAVTVKATLMLVGAVDLNGKQAVMELVVMAMGQGLSVALRAVQRSTL